MTENALRQLYEDPATQLSSGIERARRQAGILARIVAASDRSLRCVDIGCGDGMAMSVAAAACADLTDRSLDIVGFDWSVAASRRAVARGLAVAQASLAAPGLPLANESVDIVIMSEIIEHLVDTDAALREAWRVLVPGGSLLLSTPNLAAWYNRILLALGVQPLFTEVSLRAIHGRPGTAVVGHLRAFTLRAVVGLLQACSFVDLEVSGAPYHDVPWPFGPLDRLLCRIPSMASILLVSARRPD
ncbi:MAG: class I SAM-dependent methyltransferase [Actinomycetota bacterium]|jgi:SAM-dependent methyltransferase|nr:class I SAM-dependent methyltransferase [Actinomycetota bacterium]